jgi:hypothetical protein
MVGSVATAAARVPVADPAFESVAAQYVLAILILPELNLYVLDLVFGDNLRKFEQFFHRSKRHVLVVMKIDTVVP